MKVSKLVSWLNEIASSLHFRLDPFHAIDGAEAAEASQLIIVEDSGHTRESIMENIIKLWHNRIDVVDDDGHDDD